MGLAFLPLLSLSLLFLGARADARTYVRTWGSQFLLRRREGRREDGARPADLLLPILLLLGGAAICMNLRKGGRKSCLFYFSCL